MNSKTKNPLQRHTDFNDVEIDANLEFAEHELSGDNCTCDHFTSFLIVQLETLSVPIACKARLQYRHVLFPLIKFTPYLFEGRERSVVENGNNRVGVSVKVGVSIWVKGGGRFIVEASCFKIAMKLMQRSERLRISQIMVPLFHAILTFCSTKHLFKG